MAKFYLMLLILAVFALSFWVKCERGIYPVILNFSLLPLCILTYMEGFGPGALGAGICILFFLFYIFHINVKFDSVLPNLLAFVMAPIVLGALRYASKGMEYSMAKDLDSAEKETEALRNREAKLTGELKELDEKVSEIASLYEVTKEMSSTLLFGDIFHIFSEFLKKNFKFTTCKLILLIQGQGEKTIEKVYKIETPLDNGHLTQQAASLDIAKPELIDIEILNEVSKEKKVIFWEDFIAIPLITQGIVIGVLNVEGLDSEMLEKFLIVSRQFSLEIEKVQLYETVQESAVTDGLTGIFVRRYFLEMFKEEFKRSFRYNFKLSLLMIDLDHFKECNDKFGHLVGDAILKEVTGVLRQNVREIDLLGRYGGEEILILLPETDQKGAVLVAQRLREAISNQTFKAYDELLKMTISIGVSTFPDDAALDTELIESADQALYEAKRQGRNQVVCKKGVI